MTLQSTAFEADVTRCVRCPRKAEPMLSITSPKDSRTLRIFRCECGKLTSTEHRRQESMSEGADDSLTTQPVKVNWLGQVVVSISLENLETLLLEARNSTR